MRLLICTQTVDQYDPDLGFFVRWLEEFAKHCEQVEVLCLNKGDYTLPQNVRVHQLHTSNKIGRTLDLLRLSTALSYDAVLVHMNPEYAVAAGWLWRLRGKKLALWYMHKSVDLKLRIAEKLVQVIFTASKESFRLASSKVRIMGHGIDTDFFSPDTSVCGDTILSVGRLSASKRHDLILKSLPYVPQDLMVAGDGPEQSNLEELAMKLQIASRVHFLGGRKHAELRDLYRKSGVFAHTSETGSLDKVVLEALACGLPAVSTSEAFKEMLEPAGLFVPEATPLALATALKGALGKDVASLTAQVWQNHSLSQLIPAILKQLA